MFKGVFEGWGGVGGAERDGRGELGLGRVELLRGTCAPSTCGTATRLFLAARTRSTTPPQMSAVKTQLVVFDFDWSFAGKASLAGATGRER